MKRIIMLLLSVALCLAPYAPKLTAQDEQWVYAVLLWTIDEEASTPYVWNVSGLYGDFEREPIQDDFDYVADANGTLIDYLAVFGLHEFELVDVVDTLAFQMFIFKRKFN